MPPDTHRKTWFGVSLHRGTGVSPVSPAVRHGSTVHVTKLSRGLATVFRILAWGFLSFFGIVILSLFLHTFCHFCLFSVSIVHRNEEKPVLYGYVMPGCIDPAWQDKVTLGGCVVMPLSTVCPHCGWPMRYCDPTTPDNMPDLNVNAMFAASLNEQAKASLLTQIETIKSAPLGDAEEAIIAAAMSKTDLWLSARYQGLYRMDLSTGAWVTNRDDQTWNCLVKSITITGDSVAVEYCPVGAPTYFQTAATHDDGQTWQIILGALPLMSLDRHGAVSAAHANKGRRDAAHDTIRRRTRRLLN